MKRSSLLLPVAMLLIAGAAGVAFSLPRVPFPLAAVLSFFVSMLILTFADVLLPGGDSIGVSSAVVIGATLLMDARLVLGLVAVTEVIARAAARREGWRERALSEISVKAVATVIAAMAVIATPRSVQTGIETAHPSPLPYLVYLFVGVLFAGSEYALMHLLSAIRGEQPVSAWMLGGLELRGWLIAAQASTGALSVLMYRTMGPWGLVVVTILVLVTRQSFAWLLQLRQAYQSTVDVLVKTMEAQRPGLVHTAEQLASVCMEGGRAAGLRGRDLECLRYAALLHDVGLDDEPGLSGVAGIEPTPSSRIIRDVALFSDVVPILELSEGNDVSAKGVKHSTVVAAYVLVAASDALGDRRRQRRSELALKTSSELAAKIDAAVGRAGSAPPATVQPPMGGGLL